MVKKMVKINKYDLIKKLYLSCNNLNNNTKINLCVETIYLNLAISHSI